MDFPRTAIRPDIMQVLAQTNYVGEGERINQDVSPFAEQLEICAGDYAIIANSSSRLDEDFTMVKILDASEYAAQFPDWKARMDNKYLLCEYWGRRFKDPDIGWFARVRMVQISEEESATIQEWFDGDLPDMPPQWFRNKLVMYAEKLSEKAPDTVPRRVQCDNCGSYEVHLHTSHRTRSACIAGMVSKDEKVKYTSLSDVQSNCVTDAHLHCTDCDSRAELDADEVGLTEH